jgi:CHAT domain
VTLPEGQQVRVGGEALGKLMESASQRVADLSAAVFRAGQIGDLLWQEGLGLAIDYARGPDPNRAVRLEWDCPTGDLAADRFPWELLHPSTAPVGWFGEPPITAVRVVEPATAGWDPQARSGFTENPTMLVLRGADRELRAVDEAFDRFRRRTRRTRVRLLTARPREIDSLAMMGEALADQPDVLQLWAHSGDSGVRLSPAGEMVPTHVLADLVAQAAPRLVVLVGCSSGALGRALVARGVPAAVAMRVPVYDHTVQPLVEDVTAAALAGERVDLAFAAALRTYLFTGQPGASAVPMLYLAEGSDGVLFRNPHAPLP